MLIKDGKPYIPQVPSWCKPKELSNEEKQYLKNLKVKQNNCEHKKIIITEGDSEDHGCYIDIYPSVARCIECGYEITSEQGQKYMKFIKGKTRVKN